MNEIEKKSRNLEQMPHATLKSKCLPVSASNQLVCCLVFSKRIQSSSGCSALEKSIKAGERERGGETFVSKVT